MPEWLINVLQGFAKDGPAFVILLGAGWIMFRHLANQHNQHLKDLSEYIKNLTEQHKEHVASLRDVNEKAMAAKENEIIRLISEKEGIQKDRDGLYKQIKAEQKKT